MCLQQMKKTPMTAVRDPNLCQVKPEDVIVLHAQCAASLAVQEPEVLDSVAYLGRPSPRRTLVLGVIFLVANIYAFSPMVPPEAIL